MDIEKSDDEEENCLSENDFESRDTDLPISLGIFKYNETHVFNIYPKDKINYRYLIECSEKIRLD